MQILIYLSSLQKIDASVYEAASIDGASSREAFWKIALPSLSTATVVNAIYTIVTLSHFSENKVIRYINDQTYDVHGGIGYASAMAFLFFGVMVILLGIILFHPDEVSKKRVEVGNFLQTPAVDRVRSWLLGSRSRHGLVFTVILYALLIAIGFVYLYPLLFMFVTSIKSPNDLLNPMVQWVPSEFYLGKLSKAFRVFGVSEYAVDLATRRA